MHHFLEIRPGLDDLAQQACVGVQQRLAVDVNDGDIVDVPPVAGNRLQQVVKIHVGLYVFGECPLQGYGIPGVDIRAAEIGHSIIGGIGQLMRQAVGSIGSVDDSQPQNLREVKIGKRSHHHRHHQRDGQHEDQSP